MVTERDVLKTLITDTRYNKGQDALSSFFRVLRDTSHLHSVTFLLGVDSCLAWPGKVDLRSIL